MKQNVTHYWRQNNMLNGVVDEMPIYKYMPLKYTLEMIKNNLFWYEITENNQAIVPNEVRV